MQAASVVSPALSLSPVIQAQVNALMGWDMTQEKRYLVNKHKVEPAQAERLETEFKRYLSLCAIHGDSFPISKPVDEIWHVALLDHVKYGKMEQAVGRRFIHRMTLSEEEDQSLLPLYQERTLPRYEAAFGEAPDEAFWPKNHCVCTCCDCIEAE